MTESHFGAGPENYLSARRTTPPCSQANSRAGVGAGPSWERDEEIDGAGSCAGCGAFQQCIEILSRHYQQNRFLRQEDIVPL